MKTPDHTDSLKLDNFESEENSASDAFESLNLKLNATNKLLETKEELLMLQEENLRQSRTQVLELTRSLDVLQIDRDTKAIEVNNLQRAVELHTNTINELQRERNEYLCDIRTDTISEELEQLDLQRERYELEISKYKSLIDGLKFDLDIMENLYKDCYDEMMKQEKTIDLLREAYFKHYFEEYNLKLDKEILQSTIKNQKYSLECSQSVIDELSQLKEEIHIYMNNHYASTTNMTNTAAVPNISKDFQINIDDITSQLFILQETLALNSHHLDSGFNVKTKNKNCSCGETHTFQQKISELKRQISNQEKSLTKIKKRLYSSRKRNFHLKSTLTKTQGFLEDQNAKFSRLERDSLDKNNSFNAISREMFKLNEKNEMLINEVAILNNDILKFQSISNEYKQQNQQLNSQLSTAIFPNPYRDNDDVCRSKSFWLQIELHEASVKGAEICKESKQMYGGVKKWLHLMKEERRNLLMKIEELQNTNNILTSIKLFD